ncbi:MAG: hypothetical protein ABIR57_06150 [Aeromicrobium sp.]
MAWRRAKSLGKNANEAVGSWATKVDDQTGQVAQRVSSVIVVAVNTLRIPSAIVLWLPVPAIALTLLLALRADGGARMVGLVIALAMAAVSLAFGGRRRKIMQAVEDPDRLATELGIMISLSDKVGETRGTLAQLAGGGGWRVFSRLKALWGGTKMTGRWIEGIGDLPRARYFGPPKIGTTISVSVAALWLVPASYVVAVFAVIGSIASAF